MPGLFGGGSKMTSSRYSSVAILLHWLIAGLILGNLALGWRMNAAAGLAKYNLFQLHKSIGITVLLLSLVRLAWRLAVPPPRPVALKSWERVASHIVHWGFYVLMIGLPLSGWIMVSASRLNIPTLLFHLVPWPYVPGIHTLPPPVKALVDRASDKAHVAMVYGALVLLGPHVGAVVKHHFLDHAPLLSRMIPSLSRPHARRS